jgi:hypothetical protein
MHCTPPPACWRGLGPALFTRNRCLPLASLKVVKYWPPVAVDNVHTALVLQLHSDCRLRLTRTAHCLERLNASIPSSLERGLGWGPVTAALNPNPSIIHRKTMKSIFLPARLAAFAPAPSLKRRPRPPLSVKDRPHGRRHTARSSCIGHRQVHYRGTLADGI